MGKLLDAFSTQEIEQRQRPQRWTVRPTLSLCPECHKVLAARLVVENNQVMMYKTCPEHGQFSDLISSDADFLMRLENLSPNPICQRNKRFILTYRGMPVELRPV